MNRLYLLAASVALGLGMGACCPCHAIDLNKKVDGHVQYNAGRDPEYPTGADKLYLSLTVGDDWQQQAAQRNLVAWFNNDARLRKIMAQCHWNFYTTGNPHFQERLMRRVGTAVPIVTLQKPDGEALVNVTAISMPGSPGELADMLAAGADQVRDTPPAFAGQQTGGTTPIIADCPDGNCPTPSPGPAPDMSDVIDEVIPPVAQVGAILVGGIALLAAFVVLAFAWVGSRSGPAPSNRVY